MKIDNYERANMAYWTKRASGYCEVNREELGSSQHDVWQRLLTECISERFPDKEPKDIKVLDVGTGPGFFAIILAEAGFDVTAVDYTESMLENARLNAGTLCDDIRFMRMNAEELRFADASFDVLVSRNLTWNLPSPERAYAQWSRVLRDGGLLLNFDANWYNYLCDADAASAKARDRMSIAASDVRDETAGTDVDAMEAIARLSPLSAIRRPLWDINTLRANGIFAEADTDIWKRVWTREERINNASTPMFMVAGRKEMSRNA